MSTVKDGGPAFPMEPTVWNRDAEAGHNPLLDGSPGMSLRDWFAGQALVGMLASPVTEHATGAAGFAVAAYRMADAMLAERERARE